MYIIFTIGLIVLAVGAFLAWQDETAILPFFMIMLGLLMSIVLAIAIMSSSKSADFYNNVYGTNFTAEDVFWNKDVIKKSLIGEKKNMNINMNIRHEEK